MKISPLHMAAMVIGGVALVYFATRKKEEPKPLLRIQSPQVERALRLAMAAPLPRPIGV